VLAEQHHIQLAGVFDTQVAHGLAALARAGSISAPDTARIGLGPLLAEYNYSHNSKEEVKQMMDSGNTRYAVHWLVQAACSQQLQQCVSLTYTPCCISSASVPGTATSADVYLYTACELPYHH
jgi:hypothetical protein